MAVRVGIVDDHPFVVVGLRAVLALDAALEVVGTASRVAEACDLLAKAQLDVLLLDLTLGEESGMEVLKYARAAHPEVRLVVLTFHNDLNTYEEAMRAGAHGYVVKDAPQGVMRLAIHAALRGLTLSMQPLFDQLLESLPVRSEQPEILTGRERQVLAGIVQGQTNREISADLGLAVVTVKKYVQSILGKLGVSDRTQAAIVALQRGIMR